MKRILILAVVALGTVAYGQGISQLSTNTNGLAFDAKLVSNGGAAKTDHSPSRQQFETAKSTETRASKFVVELHARNMGTAPAVTHFDWFFYARDLQSKAKYIWDRGQRDLTMAPTSEQKEMLQSAELYQSTTKRSSAIPQNNIMGQTMGYQLQSSAQSSGARPYGWVVRMWSGDRLLQVQASSNDLEALARNVAQLPKFQEPKP